MIEFADYDETSGNVVAFVDPVRGTAPQPTGLPQVGVTRRLRVTRVYPDPYVELFPHLLGPMVTEYDGEHDVVVVRWPAAHYTPTALREAWRLRLNDLARVALSFTDWTVTRLVETGKPMPEGVAQERATLRAWHTERAENLLTCPAAELLDYRLDPPVGALSREANASAVPVGIDEDAQAAAAAADAAQDGQRDEQAPATAQGAAVTLTADVARS